MSDSENVTEGSNYSFQCVADADNVTVNITFDVLIDNSTTGEKCKRYMFSKWFPVSCLLINIVFFLEIFV